MLWMHVQNGRPLLHSAGLARNLHSLWLWSSNRNANLTKPHHTVTHRAHEMIEVECHDKAFHHSCRRDTFNLLDNGV